MPATPQPDVLIIDDDPVVRDSLARVLTSEHFRVRTAANADEGKLRFSIAEPDIVLLDLSMPGKSGWDTFEELSRLAPLVPIVIVTALPAQAQTASLACVAALIEKPVDMEHLVQVIRNLLAEDEKSRLARLAHRQPETRVVRSHPGKQGASHRRRRPGSR